MANIFVSYRRSDARHPAGRISDELRQRFGEEKVFTDLDSLEPGADFGEAIEETLSTCEVLIAVIGPGWLDAEEDGERRLDDPDDWVRVEIETALDRGIRVIPVLVDGAKMPSKQQLPDALARLARRNAHDLITSSWRATVRELLDNLERLFERMAAKAAVPPPAAEPAPAVEQPAAAKMADPAPQAEPAAVAEPEPEPEPAPAPAATIDWATGAKVIREIQHPEYGRKGRGSRKIACVAFSPDASRLATAGSDNSARVWEIESGLELACVKRAETVNAVAFSADGRMLAVAGEDDYVEVRDLESGDTTALVAHKRDADAVSFRSQPGPAGGAQLVSATRDGAWLWEIGDDSEVLPAAPADGAPAAQFEPKIDHRALAITADGRFIAGASMLMVRVWELDGGSVVTEVNHPGGWDAVNGVAFSPDAAVFASAGGMSKTARVWDRETGRELCCVEHDNGVQNVALGSDGRRLATASWDGTAAVWDVATGDKLATLPHDRMVTSVAFSPDGLRIATACDDHVVRVWEAGA